MERKLLFLLMAQFVNAGRHVEGIAYFEEALNRFASGLTDNQRLSTLWQLPHKGSVTRP